MLWPIRGSVLIITCLLGLNVLSGCGSSSNKPLIENRPSSSISPLSSSSPEPESSSSTLSVLASSSSNAAELQSSSYSSSSSSDRGVFYERSPVDPLPVEQVHDLEVANQTSIDMKLAYNTRAVVLGDELPETLYVKNILKDETLMASRQYEGEFSASSWVLFWNDGDDKKFIPTVELSNWTQSVSDVATIHHLTVVEEDLNSFYSLKELREEMERENATSSSFSAASSESSSSSDSFYNDIITTKTYSISNDSSEIIWLVRKVTFLEESGGEQLQVGASRSSDNTVFASARQNCSLSESPFQYVLKFNDNGSFSVFSKSRFSYYKYAPSNGLCCSYVCRIDSIVDDENLYLQ